MRVGGEDREGTPGKAEVGDLLSMHGEMKVFLSWTMGHMNRTVDKGWKDM